jgi:L,D-peptidoglycan transpeptidase YkuD (ErfK/YbiS/YcfS/YnhG family)
MNKKNMTIFVKNKHTLQIEEFKFRCCIGKNGSTTTKYEGDKKTPRGTFEIENLYFRKDRKKKPSTSLRCIEIKKIWVGVMIHVFQRNITSFLR